MGFLSKDAKSGEYVSVISEECQFQGTLDLQGSLRVDGRLEGNVDNAKYITISKNGIIQGDITAQGIVVIGSVTGSIVADSVELLSTSKIKGNIRTKNILVEGGARVNASITVVNEEGNELADKEEAILNEDAAKSKKGAK